MSNAVDDGIMQRNPCRSSCQAASVVVTGEGTVGEVGDELWVPAECLDVAGDGLARVGGGASRRPDVRTAAHQDHCGVPSRARNSAPPSALCCPNVPITSD